MMIQLTLDVDGVDFKDWLGKIGLTIDDAEDDPEVILEYLERDISPAVVMITIQ